jgi:hypothetical protein
MRLFSITEYNLLDLKHLRQLHRQIQIASKFELALHKSSHAVNFASEDADIIRRISVVPVWVSS